ncbi:MAG: biopolymer transporter ExbD [Pseudomonadota bacterium]
MSVQLKRERRHCHMNLVPVIDTMFTIIFFLMISVHFINLHEIGTDAPAIAEVDAKSKKPPLNLSLRITTENIEVRTGLYSKAVKTINKVDGNYNLEELRQLMIAIKKDHMDEKSVIFRPESLVSYNDLVKIMDVVREMPSKTLIKGIDKNGNEMESEKLFEQVIFETYI